MKRWLVERKNGEQEDVGFDSMSVHESGALIFRKSIWDSPEIIYAAGEWRTVVNNDED